MIIALKIVAVFLLVIANGFFVTSEFSMVSSNRMRIATLAEGGDLRARRLLALKDDLSSYISATQLGVTLSSLALGWIGESTLAELLIGPFEVIFPDEFLFVTGLRHLVASVIAFIVITFLHIVLGEQAPKMLGIERSDRVAMFTALPMIMFSRFFYWPIRLLNWAGTRVIRLVGLHGTAEHASAYTEEELRQLVELSRRGGHIEAGEQELINRVFDFNDADVGEAMVPRTAVTALPVTATLEEAEHIFCEGGYSRLPVYREGLDDVIGVLFMKDLMPCLRRLDPTEFNMEALLHPPLFVPSSARLGPVLQQMQGTRTHLACVVDEHGGLEGIVTLEDLLEEIVGEINDEFDEEARSQIVEEPNGTYLLDGMLAVRDANRHFRLKLAEEAGYTTMAGFLLAKAGRLLRPGEIIEHEAAKFVVEQVDRRRIRRIRFTPAPDESASAPDKNEAVA
ncbi:MAG: hemolysin family protein [Pyrinomonadaceae bacterium]